MAASWIPHECVNGNGFVCVLSFTFFESLLCCREISTSLAQCVDVMCIVLVGRDQAEIAFNLCALSNISVA